MSSPAAALYITRVDGSSATMVCAGPSGCGAHTEAGPEAFEPLVDAEGELYGLAFDCPGCPVGARMVATRVGAEQVAAVFADVGVMRARRLWHRARWDAEVLERLDHHPVLTAPIPPGDQIANLAMLWAGLEAAGWPEVRWEDAERAARRAAALERWPERG